MKKKKLLVLAIATVLILAFASYALAANAESTGAAQSAGSESTVTLTTQEENTSLQDWAAAYPEVYAEYIQPNWVTSQLYGFTRNWSHSNTELNEYGGRAYGGSYNNMDWGSCIACKSSTFNDLYAKYGDAAFMQVRETDVWSQVDWWGCDMCHTSVSDLTLRTNLVYYNDLVASQWDGVDMGIQVCGQCHNFSGVFYGIENVDDHMSFDIYRNGTDPDGLYQTLIEYLDETESTDGFPGYVDPATGATIAFNDQVDLESFMGSTMQKSGVTCVDCHTAHYNGSPLENEESLEYCLTCHASQGISDTSSMREMVETAEAELADKTTAAKEKLDQLAAVLTDATSAGTEGEAIDTARADYSKATFDFYYVSGFNIDYGKKIAHNPELMRSLIEECDKLCTDGLGLMVAGQ